jgi:glycosyltransferase involved in cell wall biosynthesis
MQKRICHISFGSVAKLPPLMHELETMQRMDYDIHVVIPEYNNDSAYLTERFPSVHFHYLNIRSRNWSENQNQILKLIRYKEFILRSRKAAKNLKADLYIAHNITAMIPAAYAANKNNSALVYRAHELFSEAGSYISPLLGLWNKVEKYYVKRTPYIVVPEAHRAQIYLDEYGAPTLPTIVRNIGPVNYEYCESDELRTQLSLNKDAVIVLYQGLMSATRCIEELVRSFEFLPAEYNLVLLGDVSEEYKTKIDAAIATSSLEHRVHFMPFVPHEQLFPITASASIGCLLYRADNRNNYYAAPNKLYEYLFAGLPVVVSNFPALVDPVKEYDVAAWADPEDPQDIARAIRSASNITGGRVLADSMRSTFRWQDEFETLHKTYIQALGT